jgi:hypothetical protein
MKKLIINPENPNGVLVDLTAEEIAQTQADAKLLMQHLKQSRSNS